MDEWDKREQVLREAIRCPECNSPRVEYPQYTRKFITPLLIELLISLGIGEKTYYCTDCQYTWRKKVQAVLERKRSGAAEPESTPNPPDATRRP
jgi:transposase-like protein